MAQNGLLFPFEGPAPRYGHSMAFDSIRNVTFLFGGVDHLAERLGDTWQYDCQIQNCGNIRLTLKCNYAKNVIAAKLFGLAEGQTITVNASCNGSKEATGNDRTKAKVKFKNVVVSGCELGLAECPTIVEFCP